MFKRIPYFCSMRLEDEIQQENFKSDELKAVVNIIYTGNWLTKKHSDFLKSYSISVPQFNLLRILRGQSPKPSSVNMLIDRMLDKTSNASRLVDKLETKKLVERKVCKVDKRQVDVFITDKGLTLLSQLDEDIVLPFGEKNKLTDEEFVQLNNLLDKLRG